MNTRKVTDIPVIEKTVGPVWDSSTKTGNYDTSRKPIDRIYIHTIDGTMEGADAVFNNAKNCRSAHYGVALSGAIWHWVDEDKTAYHCGVYGENQRSIGIEHEDKGNFADPVRTEEQYRVSATLIANICKFYTIPCDRDHIKKHSEAPFNTQCPGGLDIDKLVSMAAALLTPPPLSNPTPVTKPENLYQGIDLNNTDSVKAAIDTWKQVVDGVFVRKDSLPAPMSYEAICQALGIDQTQDQNVIIGHINTLKENFKNQVQVATGIPVADQVDGAAPPVTPAAPQVSFTKEVGEKLEGIRNVLEDLIRHKA